MANPNQVHTYGLPNHHKTLDILENSGENTSTVYPTHFHLVKLDFEGLVMEWKETVPYSTGECGCGTLTPQYDKDGDLTGHVQEYTKRLTRAEALPLARHVQDWIQANRTGTEPRVRTVDAATGHISYTHFGCGNYVPHADGSARYHQLALQDANREFDKDGNPMTYKTETYFNHRTKQNDTVTSSRLQPLYAGQKRDRHD